MEGKYLREQLYNTKLSKISFSDDLMINIIASEVAQILSVDTITATINKKHHTIYTFGELPATLINRGSCLCFECPTTDDVIYVANSSNGTLNTVKDFLEAIKDIMTLIEEENNKELEKYHIL